MPPNASVRVADPNVVPAACREEPVSRFVVVTACCQLTNMVGAGYKNGLSMLCESYGLKVGY